jgi:hypothetical protein
MARTKQTIRKNTGGKSPKAQMLRGPKNTTIRNQTVPELVISESAGSFCMSRLVFLLIYLKN